jgi:uncharacterized membrane protein HdeD (DUF308 family)
MIRLALLLLGPDFIRARWRVLAAIGVLWAALGVAIFIDALDGDVWFPVHVFGYLLILEALVTLVATTSHLGTQTVLRKSRGVVFLILGILMIDPHRGAEFILALLFGVVVGVDGVLRVSAAWVVRLPGWRASLFIRSGLGTLLLALRLRKLPPNLSLAALFARNQPVDVCSLPGALRPSPSRRAENSLRMLRERRARGMLR